MSNHSKFVHTFLSVLIQIEFLLATPPCNPSEYSKQFINWKECNPFLDGLSWYGITVNKYSFADAANICSQFGAELISIENFYIDQCAFEAILSQNISNSLILYSGKFNHNQRQWEWCPSFCRHEFGFYGYSDNWYNGGFYSNGNCMGGYLENSKNDATFENYGWVKDGCATIAIEPVHAMCRLDCSTPFTDPNIITTTDVEIDVTTSTGSFESSSATTEHEITTFKIPTPRTMVISTTAPYIFDCFDNLETAFSTENGCLLYMLFTILFGLLRKVCQNTVP